MAAVPFATTLNRRVSLAEIDAAVSARLGPTRVTGNAQPACFNRQVAMYLARHVRRWSSTAIGRFYNGRDHATVWHGIQRIEAIRESDPEVDALLADLKQQLSNHDADTQMGDYDGKPRNGHSEIELEELADMIAQRVCTYLEKHLC